MTDPSQYFKGRTVQEQMDEVIGYVDTRAAEVATAAIAADVAQVHQDMLDADADASAAAASAAAAAGTLANAVKKTGESTQTIEGDITMSTGDLGIAGDVGVQGQLSVLGGCDLRAPVTVPAPSNNTDAATKKYVDDQDASLKTYVDGQDALAVPILNVNAYAVGLSGNQTALGLKSGRFSMKEMSVSIPQPATNGKYRLMYTIKDVAANAAICGKIQDTSNANSGFYGDFVAVMLNSSVAGKIVGVAFGGYTGAAVYFAYTGTDIDVWVQDVQYRPKQIRIDNVSVYGQLQQPVIETNGTTTTDDYITYKTYTVTGSVTQ